MRTYLKRDGDVFYIYSFNYYYGATGPYAHRLATTEGFYLIGNEHERQAIGSFELVED